jgi:murein DD-endopeptidase MepM/ murein hydrolase activator NlpD
MPAKNIKNKFEWPIAGKKNVSLKFGQKSVYDGKDWGMHLGIDIPCRAENKIKTIADGLVVYSGNHLGIMENNKIKKRNWGGIIIIQHKINRKIFYSLYGHLQKRFFEKGRWVKAGDIIGLAGKAMTPENGLWEEEHLHLGIYQGKFVGEVLPGYFRKDGIETNINDWLDPLKFFKI